MRKAFTLIEVMVAVVIISVVIMALLQMKGNSSHIFLELNKRVKVTQFSSFFTANKNYGFENKSISLDMLLDDFEVESDLRRELKSVKSEVIYQEIKNIEADMVLEIGQSVLKTDKSSVGLLRLRVQ